MLAYHDVVASPATGFSVTAAALRAHIRLLRALGMRIVALRELHDRVLDGRSTDGLAVLTFDDGLVGVHRHALPVLTEEAVPATVFAVSSAWGAEPPWWPGSARTLTGDELRDVLVAGVGVEAHTRTHPSLPGLDDARLERELRGCRDELETLCGAPVRALAYPGGHHDPRVRSAARAAGFTTGFTFLNGRLVGTEDPFRLPRLTMTAASSRARLAYHLARPAGSWPDHQSNAVGPVAP